MRNLLRDLRSAWWQFLKPEFDEPDDFDDVSHAARLQFVAGSRHPKECDTGCQCKWGGGDTS